MASDISFVEVKCKTAASENPETVIQKQGDALLQTIHKQKPDYIFALDERGKTFNSPEFSTLLESIKLNGQPHIGFVIGGAYGLSQNVRKRCDKALSFGNMVWPHRLVGLMLTEQLYRAEMIAKGHPYHK